MALPMVTVFTAINEAILPVSVPGMPIAPSTMDGVILKASLQAINLCLSTMVPIMLQDIKKMDRMISHPHIP